MAKSAAYIDLDEGAAPATPSAGKVRIYAKTDGSSYQKDDAGTETGLASGSSLGAWTSYTPTWTAATSNPTLGNGTITAKYKALDATTYAISIVVTFGSTTNAGSGVYSFSLPSGVTSAARIQVIAASIEDAGTAYFSANAWVGASSTTVTHVTVADATGTRRAASNAPITWATGDQIVISGIIEVA